MQTHDSATCRHFMSSCIRFNMGLRAKNCQQSRKCIIIVKQREKYGRIRAFEFCGPKWSTDGAGGRTKESRQNPPFCRQNLKVQKK